MALPDYLESNVKDYARNLTATTSAPIDTSKFTGRSFVAGEDKLQIFTGGVIINGSSFIVKEMEVSEKINLTIHSILSLNNTASFGYCFCNSGHCTTNLLAIGLNNLPESESDDTLQKLST